MGSVFIFLRPGKNIGGTNTQKRKAFSYFSKKQGNLKKTLRCGEPMSDFNKNQISLSLWSDQVELPTFETLSGDIKTDVLIIGGGMTGVLCAYFLEQLGADYLLVEAKTIGNGVTKNTTAKITSQHGLIYSDLIKNAGEEKAEMYLAANQQALAKYKQLCRNIDCDFEEKSAFVYALEDYHKVERELHALEGFDFPAYFVQKLPLPFEVAGAIEFEHQAQFHPLKFLGALAKGLHIHENTFVKLLDGHTALTKNGKIKAKSIIVATHFPFMNRYGGYYLRLYQHRSYVIALANAVDVHGMYVDEAQNGMSFRNHQDLLLLGGGDHRTGKDGGKWQELRTFAKAHYPEAREVYAWSTQDCMSLDSVPYIGPYAKSTQDIFVATGFNKWGMTSAMTAAMILTDLLGGKENAYASVFTPQRSIIKPQLFLNGIETTLNFLTPTRKRCTHLGCALKWNEEEQSWDCPCHGSRFADDGRLLDNPALKPLKKKDRNASDEK